MLSGFLLLLAFVVGGDLIGHVLGLPLPGPVIGMILLLAWLGWRKQAPPENLTVASQGVLQHLSLLFVPAGVGLILHLGRLQHEWLAMQGSVIFGTLLSLGITGLLLKYLSARTKSPHD